MHALCHYCRSTYINYYGFSARRDALGRTEELVALYSYERRKLKSKATRVTTHRRSEEERIAFPRRKVPYEIYERK